MKRKKQTRLANPLLNKLQRYAATSILFRQAEPGANLLSGAVPVSPSSLVVKAVILPADRKDNFVEAAPHAKTEAMSKPITAMDTAVPVQHQADFAAGTSQMRPAPVSSAEMPVVEPGTAASPSLPPTIQRKPDPSMPSEDRNWSRLETIMRLHKEKQEAEEDAAYSEETTINTDTAVSPPPPAKPSRKGDITASSVDKTSSVQLSPSGEPARNTDQIRESGPLPKGRDKAANVPPAAIPVDEVGSPSSASAPPAITPVDNEVETSTTAVEKSAERETAVLAELTQISTPEKIHPAVGATEQAPVMRQPSVQSDQVDSKILPNVFPAREVATIAGVEIGAGVDMPVQKEEATVPPSPAGESSYEAKGQDAPGEAAASLVSENVAAAAPADRPPATIKPVPLQAVWDVEAVAEEDTTPPIIPPKMPAPSVPVTAVQRQPLAVDTAVQDRLADVPPGMPTDSSVPLLRPLRPRPSQLKVKEKTAVVHEPTAQRQESTAQRQQQDKVTAPSLPEPKSVATQIGELPEDLWHLIGQEPPAPQKESKQTEIEDTSLLSPTAVTPQTPIVQKEPEPTSEPEPPKAMPDEEGGGGEESEIDTDQLARQVYTEIKQRLAVEWERIRGHYQ